MRTLQTIFKFGPSRLGVPTALLHAGLVLAATALLSSCASEPTKSESMIDEQANFNDYKTFGWLAPGGASGGNEPLPLVETHIRAAITTEMRSKAYVEALAGATADLLINYEAARVEKVKSSPFRIGIGIGSYGSSGGASVNTSTSGIKNISEGSLVIYAVDSARNAEVWRSRVSQELGEGNVSPEVIQGIVAEALSDFPARTDAE